MFLGSTKQQKSHNVVKRFYNKKKLSITYTPWGEIDNRQGIYTRMWQEHSFYKQLATLYPPDLKKQQKTYDGVYVEHLQVN